MKTIGSLSVAIALLLGLLYWQYTESQDLLNRAVSAEQTRDENAAVITQLTAQAEKRRQAQQRMARKQQQLHATLTTQQHTIQRLERENANYRKWATAPLPDAARRVRQRPAITGADDYQRYLSSTRAVRPPRDSAQPERRPDN